MIIGLIFVVLFFKIIELLYVKWTKKNVRWYVPSFVASVWLDKNFSIFRIFKQSTFKGLKLFGLVLSKYLGSAFSCIMNFSHFQARCIFSLTYSSRLVNLKYFLCWQFCQFCHPLLVPDLWPPCECILTKSY